MITAPVNKIIPFSCVDGYGNRTAIFFQGCNQDCLYCHNPETIHVCNSCKACVAGCPTGALFIEDEKVLYDYDKCCDCDTCLRTCSFVASPKIRQMTAEQLFSKVEFFFPFIDGITTSGGECSLHLDFLTEFYAKVREAGKTTYMDTNGRIPLWDKTGFLTVMDKAMIDLKAGSEEEHMMLTGQGLSVCTDNIRQMAQLGKLYEIRTVVVPGVLDNRRTVELGSSLIASYPDIRYKLIKYRHYGVREKFSMTKTPSDDLMEELGQIARRAGVKEIILT